MNKGYLGIVLHAHLPYVHHPEHDSFFEENWLFEAISECYLPLIDMLDRLQRDRIRYRLTVSLSPTLITQLRSPLLQERYLRYLHQRIELAEREMTRTAALPELQNLAVMYQRFYRGALHTYKNHYHCDLLAAFQKHRQSGHLQLITTAATHGFLPLLNLGETAVRTQIEVGLDTFAQAFGFKPQGFWLPECAYYPGLEHPLKQAGIRYFFVESRGILQATPTSPHAVYAPVDCGNGVIAFGRDPACSEQVWSAQTGYPSDAAYREYYRDIGFELPLDYLAPYLVDGQIRSNTGFKYQRITGGEQAKQLYDPQHAMQTAKQHAEDFINSRQRQIDLLTSELDRTPIIIAPYDAELFGHWWFEGPHWLEQVLRLASQDNNGIEAVDCEHYLSQSAAAHLATPAASTWGESGHSGTWLNDSNDWIYPLLHKASAEMEKLAHDLATATINPLQQRAANQALRSLLLAQASDWPFILKSGTTTEYARKRFTDHLARFNYLHDSIRKNRIDERYLTALEIMDDIFPQIDFRQYHC